MLFLFDLVYGLGDGVSDEVLAGLVFAWYAGVVLVGGVDEVVDSFELVCGDVDGDFGSDGGSAAVCASWRDGHTVLYHGFDKPQRVFRLSMWGALGCGVGCGVYG